MDSFEFEQILGMPHNLMYLVADKAGQMKKANWERPFVQGSSVRLIDESVVESSLSH